MNFKTIRILGKTYSIREDIELHDDGKFGLCNHRKQEITVYPDQHEDQIRDTILHESIHAIDYGISIGLKEEQVHALACAIYSFFKDNPEVLRWMFKPEG